MTTTTYVEDEFDTDTETEVVELSVAESHAMFNRLAQNKLGIGRTEFLARLDRGEYDQTDSEDVIRLRIMASFAR